MVVVAVVLTTVCCGPLLQVRRKLRDPAPRVSKFAAARQQTESAVPSTSSGDGEGPATALSLKAAGRVVVSAHLRTNWHGIENDG